MDEKPAVPEGQNTGYIASCGEFTALCSNVKLLTELNQIQDVHLFVMYVLTVSALQNEMSVWLTSICLSLLRRKLIYIM
jgi:hypothetical protein